jgi:hypothetical protein
MSRIRVILGGPTWAGFGAPLNAHAAHGSGWGFLCLKQNLARFGAPTAGAVSLARASGDPAMPEKSRFGGFLSKGILMGAVVMLPRSTQVRRIRQALEPLPHPWTTLIDQTMMTNQPLPIALRLCEASMVVLRMKTKYLGITSSSIRGFERNKRDQSRPASGNTPTSEGLLSSYRQVY